MVDDELVECERIDLNRDETYTPVIVPLNGRWDKYHVYFITGFCMRYGGNNGYGWHHHTLKGAQKRIAREAAKLEAKAERKRRAKAALKNA